MAIKVDKITKTINTPDLFLCNRSCKQIGAIHDVSELNIYMSANSVNEITFSVEKETNTDVWDSIETLKVVRAEGYGYFEIAVDKNVSTSTKKVVTGVSLEAELGQLLLFNFSVNGETDRNNDDNWTNGSYVSTTIYNPSDTKHSLLHRMLADKASHWSLGSITPTITINNQEYPTANEVRTFEWDNKSIYDALMDIEQELDVVFTFTITASGRRINMYDANKIGSDTSIYIDNENLVNEFTCSSNKDSIKNCFKVVGGDDLINAYIKAVNPNSSDYIYRISDEQMNDMSAELVAKINSYNALYESKRAEYTTICNNLFNAIDNVSLYRDSKTPTRTKVTTTASNEASKLSTKLSGITLACKDIDTLTKVGAKKIIKEVAQVCIDYRYDIEVSNEVLSGNSLTYTIKVSNQTNNDDAAELTNITTTFATNESTYYQYIIDNLLSDYSGKGEVNTVAYLESTYKNTNPVDYPYCLSELKSYCDAYSTCVVTLQEYSKDTTNSLYSMYYDYWQKWNIMKNAVSKMEEYVDSLIAIQNGYEAQKNAIQKQLDFASYLGNTLYDEFCLYRRDDIYENSNYISDGLSNAECIRMAEKLVAVATKELYKASLPQTTYTTSLNNMFNNPIFEPFYEQFELFNWINAYVDDKLVKLRLIGYKINFDSQDNIEVEFSDNVRNADGLSDLQSLLGQAKSMATSYSSTKQQAQKGNNANAEFTRLKSEGLNSALMNIKSANEEVTMDASGINCKSMDQNGEYDAHQLRITGSNIVMTDDDWQTARMAIGRMTYNGKEIYGVISDALIGDLIIGNQLNIYNGDKSMSMDKDGFRLTNNVNTIILDPSADKNMLMDMQKNGESIFYVNKDGELYIDGNIYGGSLHLENKNGIYVDINPNKENIFEIGNKNANSGSTSPLDGFKNASFNMDSVVDVEDVFPSSDITTNIVCDEITPISITDCSAKFSIPSNIISMVCDIKIYYKTYSSYYEKDVYSYLWVSYNTGSEYFVAKDLELDTNYIAMIFDNNNNLISKYKFTTLSVAHTHDYQPCYKDVIDYKFIDNGDGYWVSSNKDIHGSDSIGLWEATVSESTQLDIQYIVSSESGYDKMFIYIDENEVVSRVSGEADSSYSTNIASGTHTIKAIYRKDGSASEGDDCAKIKFSIDVVPKMNQKVSETHMCSICEKEEDHNMENGVCTVCGYSS